MAGQPGAFENALDNLRSTQKEKPDRDRPASQSADQPDPKPASASKKPGTPPTVRRLRKPGTVANTASFNQRVDIDVINFLYDTARETGWTMNRTLREAARTLAKARGDKKGAGL
ncbi:hypothetical protein RKLH11_3985 [Rhodobacteraceae bacterium KLH11]|nr:hypothetical protein RKLH11_3985 [Rhodobacteraceae bacterium KLH11]